LSKTKRAQQAQSVSATIIRRTAIAQAITFAFMAGTVQAQTAPTTPTPAAEAQKIDSVTVTGIRRGIEAAISQKRNSDSIVEAISAEDIGKLPDASVAESISRLPGVASQRTGGRAQQISIRGLAPDFAGALLNGREQASTGDSRGVEFDQYPSELLGSVLIYKTPNGGLVGQGLSGTIDMRTVRPLDFAKRQFAVSGRKQKSGVGLDTDGGSGSRINLSYIDQFADRKVGVAIGFARFDEKTPQTTRFEAWGVADNAQLNGAGPNLRAPGGFNSWLDQTTQKRDGLMAVLQFRPNKEFNTVLDVFTSKFTRDKSSVGFQAPIGFSSGGGYDPNGTLIAATVNGNVASSGTYNNFKGVVRSDQEYTTDKLDSIGLKSEWKFMPTWSATLDLSRSSAKRTGSILESTAGLPGNGNQGGQTGTISWTGFDGNNLQGATYSSSVNYADRSAISLTDVMGWGGGNALPQAGYSKIPNVEDTLNGFRVSATKTFADNPYFSSADFGINVSDRSKTRAYIEGRFFIGQQTVPYATAPIPGTGTAIAGASGISVATWNPSQLLGSTYTIAGKLVADIANKDWTVNEKVTTLYTKWDIDSKLFGLPVRGNIGAQIVNTDQSSRAFSIDGRVCPGDVCPTTDVTDGRKYTDFLPSLNLVWELSGDQVVRFGLGRALARANINDMRASFGFSLNSATGESLLKGDAGNPKLDPFRANAVDISWEKYWGTKAYVSVAAFHKQLTSYIIRQETPFDFRPYVTAATPLPTSGPFAGSTLGLLTQPFNGKGGSLSGLELAASFPFEMAAPAFKGFGAFGNYSYTRSSVELPTSGFANDNISAGTISLPGLSKNVMTLGVYFEANGFSARVAQRSRSDFVGDVTNIFGDRSLTFVKGEKIVDLQLGYEVQSGPAKGLGITFQASNIENTPFIRYRDVPTNEIENTKYGRTYLFGLNYKF
jgi:iron complex outermembrane recepter protein